MNYDLDFRYRRALQPDALATIATATQAVVDAMQDARNAGIDPARDPATILLARHVGRIALGHAPDETFAEDLPLRRQCLAKIDELKSKPALVALARRGIGYDPEAKRAFAGLIALDLPGPLGTTTLTGAANRLAQTLADCFERGRASDLVLPEPPTVLELAGLDALIK